MQNERLSEKVNYRKPITAQQREHLRGKLLDKINFIKNEINAIKENMQRRVEENERAQELINSKDTLLKKYERDYAEVLSLTDLPETLSPPKEPEPAVEPEEVLVESIEPEPEPVEELVEELAKHGMSISDLLKKIKE